MDIRLWSAKMTLGDWGGGGGGGGGSEGVRL